MTIKTKVINRIEEKLQELEEGSMRYQVLETCRLFKTTWIELGQVLFSVHTDRLHEDWGYLSFERYCTQELGIKQATALKLVKSYQFLEKEEPSYIQRVKSDVTLEGKHADVESVNLLRMAKKNKNVSEEGYEKLKKRVLHDGHAAEDVRKELRMMSESIKDEDPELARASRRQQFLKQVVRNLEKVRLEAMANRFLPANLMDQLEAVSLKVEKELNR